MFNEKRSGFLVPKADVKPRQNGGNTLSMTKQIK